MCPASDRARQWAGVAQPDRRARRSDLLIAAAFDLLGADGESAITVRAVCRQAGLNSRYFYESFATPEELIGAVYDATAAELAQRVTTDLAQAGSDLTTRLRAGIYGVLHFCTADPRRGRVLFTEARSNRTLTVRRDEAARLLLAEITREEAAARPTGDPLARHIRAALFAGAMVELARQWLDGELGSDLNAAVDAALAPSMAVLLAADRVSGF